MVFRKRTGERERKKNVSWSPPVPAPTGNRTLSVGGTGRCSGHQSHRPGQKYERLTCLTARSKETLRRQESPGGQGSERSQRRVCLAPGSPSRAWCASDRGPLQGLCSAARQARAPRGRPDKASQPFRLVGVGPAGAPPSARQYVQVCGMHPTTRTQCPGARRGDAAARSADFRHRSCQRPQFILCLRNKHGLENNMQRTESTEVIQFRKNQIKRQEMKNSNVCL